MLKRDVKLQPTCSIRILPEFCWHTEFCSYHCTLYVLAVHVVFISFILKTTIWDGHDCWKVKHALTLCLTSLIATYPTLGWAASPSTVSLEKKSCLLSALNKIITKIPHEHLWRMLFRKDLHISVWYVAVCWFVLMCMFCGCDAVTSYLLSSHRDLYLRTCSLDRWQTSRGPWLVPTSLRLVCEGHKATATMAPVYLPAAVDYVKLLVLLLLSMFDCAIAFVHPNDIYRYLLTVG